MAVSPNWEDVRKRARQLENEIDLKLVAFSKLGSAQPQQKVGEAEPLLDDEHVFENMSTEIEQLLTELHNVNENMGEKPVSSTAVMHTLQRHREILRDYEREHARTRSAHEARRERERLLQTTRSSAAEAAARAGLSRRDAILKEAQHLKGSDRLVDEQIGTAIETRERLAAQRQSLKRLRTRFNDLSNRFPALHGLIARIGLRRRRDSIIVGLVVAICTLLLLIYAFL